MSPQTAHNLSVMDVWFVDGGEAGDAGDAAAAAGGDVDDDDGNGEDDELLVRMESGILGTILCSSQLWKAAHT